MDLELDGEVAARSFLEAEHGLMKGGRDTASDACGDADADEEGEDADGAHDDSIGGEFLVVLFAPGFDDLVLDAQEAALQRCELVGYILLCGGTLSGDGAKGVIAFVVGKKGDGVVDVFVEGVDGFANIVQRGKSGFSFLFDEVIGFLGAGLRIQG